MPCDVRAVESSVFISAAAGTGKTYLLVLRILKLLLAGDRRILCITFTNAAAAEIQDRVLRYASRWVVISDEELSSELVDIFGLNTPAVMRSARNLFIKILEKPLRVCTIHAFCYDMLLKFTYDANISYNSVVFDGSTLYDRIVKGLLEQQVQLNIDEDLDALINSLHRIIEVLHNGSARDVKYADKLQSSSQFRDFHAIRDVFLDKSGAAKPISSVVTQKLRGELDKYVADVKTQVLYIDNKLTNFHQQHALMVARRARRIYENMKKKQLYIDYNDLIMLFLKLLSNHAVMFNVYANFSDILVDEAQDNSRSQWHIVKRICCEFAEHDDRTFFVIGDVKQSIYGFQGARPRIFMKIQRLLARVCRRNRHRYCRISLDRSFRFCTSINRLINALFYNTQLGRMIYGSETYHRSVRTEAGLVEVWPLVTMQQDPWMPRCDAQRQLAREIASTVNKWLISRRILTARNRAIECCDIMILVRHRSALSQYLIDDFAAYEIPIAFSQGMQDGNGIMDMLGNVLQYYINPHNRNYVAKLPHIYNNMDNIRHFSGLTPIEGYFFVVYSVLRYYNNREKNSVDALTDKLLQYGFILTYEVIFELMQEQVATHEDGAVRIITVHGAKGLQSPVVILPDTTSVPSDYSDEYVRLLYVAVTRAEDELYIAGHKPLHKGSWYNMVHDLDIFSRRSGENGEVLYID